MARSVPARVLLSRVRAKLSSVKFIPPQGGGRKRFTPMQHTIDGTVNITDNPDVKFSSMPTGNPLWRSAAPLGPQNIPRT